MTPLRKQILLGAGIGAAGVALAFGVLLLLAWDGAKVKSFNLSGEAVGGRPIVMEVTLENGGLLAAKYKAILTADGVEACTQDVRLDPRETRKLRMEVAGLEPGMHAMAVGSVKADVKVLKPASFKVTELTVQPETPLPGEDVTVSATVDNSGEVKGEYAAALMLDGILAETIKTQVEPGGRQTVTGTIPSVVRGVHSVSIGETKKEFQALAPADITIADLSLSTDVAKPGETVTVTAKLKNSGDLSGTYQLQLLVNGTAAGRQEISVEGNGSKECEFDVTQSKAGSYVIKAGDREETLRILQITRPANGTFLVRRAKNGSNRITIINQNTTDSIVALAKTSNPGSADICVYVRAGSKVTVKGVPDGNFNLFYSTGKDYDASSKTFYTDPSYLQSDSIYNFSSPGYRYTVWTVTLYTASGNSTASRVDDDDFPK